ncbi:16S rRNA (cytidine1402-2'-O)-methyltransferase [Nitrosomonas cryotolerans]|uniref:16S rRNA (Cytidine1402-2'-O)-methyltransferase n=1 Tax=Nitrosomonas cryotolerans ATCC 49181 TaxID=1131553 RepID=A0A1N6J8F2_9PROT|nr:SAM-dependent methyltransferase [Nitrosomonas cryotolerans]SFP44466.1 16S rRNA (cytidine1402-2'-O)-methyltransferase [Nitrosomonas cryotolerans]SIO40557.1 16S rRNA (cytidine1402-2'-O)-methyltransferase [Nitrosomonas cryotolerans ATCC 49181]
MTGTLYLIPTLLSGEDINWVIPSTVQKHIADISYYIVEHPKTARQFLKCINCNLPLQKIHMEILNEHTQSHELLPLLDPLLAGHDVGILSEAGCPAVADPGAELIRLAHQQNIRVMPLVGPSSILLALMASGLNGQRFSFHGYLPVERDVRVKKIIELEQQSIAYDQTQIFIEAPYRNQRLLESLIKTCHDNTDLCIAANLTFVSEYIATKTIKAWRCALPEINKIPAIFLFHGK